MRSFFRSLAVLCLSLVVATGFRGRAAAEDAPFRRADANADGFVDLSDPVFTLQFLFLGSAAPPCLDAADANDDGLLNLTDGIHTLGALFRGDPPSPPPGAECGADPTPDDLGCASFAPCALPPLPFVVISEFLAVNTRTLRDGNREFSDWIEILSEGDSEVNLEGYHLTDDPEDPTRYTFPGEPDATLAPGERLVVFASGADAGGFVDRDGFFHTNFRLDAGGEYLALVLPDGETIVSSYGPDVPEQTRDVSYGLLRDTVLATFLVEAGDPAKLLAPAETLPPGWTARGFDDGSWEAGAVGAGYETAVDGLFTGGFETDVEGSMHGRTAALCVRIPFEVPDPALLESLTLWMRHDGGFVAHLNGREVVRANVPAFVTHESVASAPRADAEVAGAFARFDIGAHIDALAPGRNVLAVLALNESPASERFLVLPVLEARARGDAEAYFRDPTPGEPNAEGFSRIVADTRFNVDRGFRGEAFELAITSATPGATIRYTLDGSAPGEDRGALYTEPIRVGATTVVRAIASRPNLVTTNVDTQTYLFLDGPGGVLRQPRRPSGYPDRWAGNPADYEMDPEIVGHPEYREAIADDLRALATLSIVMDRRHLFGSAGLYDHPEERGLAWERPVSVEIFSPDGSEELQVEAGMRIHGGAGRRPEHPKHAFRFIFRRRYGAGKLEHDLFGSQPFGSTAAESFDKLVVRAGFNNTFPHWYNEQALRSQYARDQWARDLQLEMGHPSPRGRYFHLYLNGLYWGLYNVTERPDEDFGASYFGGDDADYDVIKNGSVAAGSGAAWSRLQSLAASGARTPEQYEEVKRLADLENLIDYMLENFYFGNVDWDRNNMVAIRRRDPPGPFRFVVWDAEFAASLPPGGQPNQWPPILDINRTGLNNTNAPSAIFQGLRRNEEFRILLADRIHKRFANGGALTPEAVTRTWLRVADRVDRAVVGESARWGDFRRDVFASRDPPGDFPLLTRNEHYLAHQRFILEEYFPRRTDIVLRQMSAARFMPDIEPPVISPSGGPVASGTVVEVSGSRGTLFYTLDGSDPRLEGGDVSPRATLAGESVAATLLATGAAARFLVPGDGALGSAWIEPGFDDSGWESGPTGLGYDGGGDYADLIATDVGESMQGRNASIYVRIRFDAGRLAEIDFLTLRMKYDDAFVAYLNGREIASRNAPAAPGWDASAVRSHADSRAVLFEDVDITEHRDLLQPGENLLALHGLVRSLSDTDFLLVPEIAWREMVREEIVIVRTARVKARSLVDGMWTALADERFRVDNGLRITEIMYHPPGPENEAEAARGDEDFEFIELSNRGDAAVSLADLRIVGAVQLDFGDRELTPGGSVVLVRDPEAFEARYGPSEETGIVIAGVYDGRLSNGGERILLGSSRGEVMLDFAYDDRWYPETDGLGHSLVLVDPDSDPATHGERGSWRPSAERLGSPGRVE